MEDPNEEWAVEEYTYEENKGKVGWILNKGLTLGKNMLVTGMVISSAPLVLPPLVIISAIGVAVSVPSGVFLASYACTQKLMNTLLPCPTHPPPDLLEYETITRRNVEEEELIQEGGGYSWLEEDIDIQREEEKEMEDIRRTLEMRIELMDEENDAFEEKSIAADDYGQDRVRMYKQAADADLNVISEENHDEEDDVVGDHLIVKEVKLMVEIEEIRTEGGKDENERMPLLDESRHEEPIMVQGMLLDVLDEEHRDETIGVTGVIMEEDGDQERVNGILDEDLVKGTGRFPEKIRDVGKFTTGSAEKDKQIVEKLQGGEDEDEGYTMKEEEIGIAVDEICKEEIAERRNIEEDPEVGQDEVIKNHEDIEGTTFFVNRDEVKSGDVPEEELIKETRGLLEKIRDEGKDDKETEDKQGIQDIKGTTIEISSIAFDGNGNEVRFGDILEEELIEETRGLLEKIKDEGKDDKVTDDRQESREDKDWRSICNVDQEVGVPLDNSFNGEFGSRTPLGKTEADSGKRNVVGTSKEGEEMQEKTYEGEMRITQSDLIAAEQVTEILESNNAYRSSEAEKLIGGICDSTIVCSMRKKDPMPSLNSEASWQGGMEEDTMVDLISLKTEETIVTFPSAGAIEVADESGIDLFDDQNTAGHEDSYAVNATTEGEVLETSFL